jgi:hypothetical protein
LPVRLLREFAPWFAEIAKAWRCDFATYRAQNRNLRSIFPCRGEVRGRPPRPNADLERLCKAYPIGGESRRRNRKEADDDGLCRDLSPGLERPEEFWAEAAEAIDWECRWDRVLDASRPRFYRWFPGARLNVCGSAVDRHVAAGRDERTALIWDSPVTGQIKRFT